MKILDMAGQKFGRLTVIEFSRKNVHRHAYWVCECECGNKVDVNASHLKSGHTRSCGCFNFKSFSLKRTKHKPHGMSGSPEHKTWRGMIKRCTNPNAINYKNYGGRGITVCDRWLNSFENFYADMGEKPSKSHSIDRLNNNLGYSKDNCRWSVQIDQQRNRRNNRWITVECCVRTVAEWADIVGASQSVIYSRLSRGWSEYDAVMGRL
jgi:hypothetical protein